MGTAAIDLSQVIKAKQSGGNTPLFMLFNMPVLNLGLILNARVASKCPLSALVTKRDQYLVQRGDRQEIWVKTQNWTSQVIPIGVRVQGHHRQLMA